MILVTTRGDDVCIVRFVFVIVTKLKVTVSLEQK